MPPQRREAKDFSPFIRWLDEAMRQRGVNNLYELATGSGVPYGTITGNTYKPGEPRSGPTAKRKHQPRESTVRKLAAYFGGDPDYLLQLAGYDVPERPRQTREVHDIRDPEFDVLASDIKRELSADEREAVKDLMRWTLERKRRRLTGVTNGNKRS